MVRILGILVFMLSLSCLTLPYQSAEEEKKEEDEDEEPDCE